MPNICSFTLSISGPEKDLDLFKATVEEFLEKLTEGFFQGQFVFHIDPATWGPLLDHAFLWLTNKEPIRQLPGGGLRMEGEAKWNAPSRFVGRASALFPQLFFDLTGTTEYELGEHWTAHEGHLVQVEERLEDIQAEEVLLWIKDGKILVGPTIQDGKVIAGRAHD